MFTIFQIVGTILFGAALAFAFAAYMASEDASFRDWIYKAVLSAEAQEEKKKLEKERKERFDGFMKERYWANPDAVDGDGDKGKVEESNEAKKDR